MVYIGSWDGYVYALNALTGKEIWRFHTWRFDAEIGIVATPVVANGIVYIGSQGIASFYAINASTGKEVWKGVFLWCVLPLL
jgi:outer membrane protein assembly factor BamB